MTLKYLVCKLSPHAIQAQLRQSAGWTVNMLLLWIELGSAQCSRISATEWILLSMPTRNPWHQTCVYFSHFQCMRVAAGWQRSAGKSPARCERQMDDDTAGPRQRRRTHELGAAEIDALFENHSRAHGARPHKTLSQPQNSFRDSATFRLPRLRCERRMWLGSLGAELCAHALNVTACQSAS